MRSKWVRVSKKAPCLVCGRPDWCSFSEDGAVAMCQRVESSRRIGDAGWLHRLSEPIKYERPVSQPKPAPVVKDMSKYARQCADRLGEPVMLAKALGVKPDALRRLSAGWTGRAYSFPMSDPERNVIGIRLRTTAGKKYAVKGSRNGLFLPDRLSDMGEVLLIAEGPTDVVALLGLGFDVIGRPSNTGAEDMLASFIKQRSPQLTVLLIDRDRPGSAADRLTTKAAMSLAAKLRCETRLLRPPAKDAREWVRSGATEPNIRAAIAGARSL